MQSLRWEFLFRWFIWGLFSKGHGGSKIGQREITTQEWGLSWTLASIRPHTKALESGSRLTFGLTLRQGAWFLESECQPVFGWRSAKVWKIGTAFPMKRHLRAILWPKGKLCLVRMQTTVGEAWFQRRLGGAPGASDPMLYSYLAGESLWVIVI